MNIIGKIIKTNETAYIRIIELCKEFRYLPQWFVLLSDLIIVFISFTLTYFICYNLYDLTVITVPFLVKASVHFFFTLFFFYIFKTYKGIIRYSTYRDALRLFLSLCLSHLSLFLLDEIYFYFYQISLFPVKIGFIINFALAFIAIFTVRMFIKVFYDYTRNNPNSSEEEIPMLMYGISSATIELAKLIIRTPNMPYKLTGFLVSDFYAANKRVLNLPVFYVEGSLESLIWEKHIKAMMINPSELDSSIKQKINDQCLRYNVELLSAPSITEKKVRKLRIEELLGRIPIEIDTSSIRDSLDGQCVLVTGAAGSIGSELVRQISNFNPGLLLLCDAAETPIHLLRLELAENFPHLKFSSVICDVRNFQRMEKIFEKYKPKFVYHAAAYKHVPLMEENPSEAILTNVLGTRNVAYLSVKNRAEAFVMISTDKAVNPGNIMGASKRIAEMYVQSISQEMQCQNKQDPSKNYNTRIITTRFGNVLGSNGSVIPRFQEQIEKGGPVTVTHKDIIRYFMTIPEACRLVLEAGNMGKGGEIFVFDMGEPVRIADLAERMIRLSGYRPYIDIDIKFTGLRPGEKLYEELLNDKEHIKPTHNPKIMIGKIREQNFTEVLKQILFLIDRAKESDDIEVIRVIKEIVPEFVSENPHI